MLFRQFPLLAKLDKRLNAIQWPVPLQLVSITMRLAEPALQHELLDLARADVDAQLLDSDGDLVLVGICLWSVIIPEAELHLVSEGLYQVLALQADFPVEDVFHHLEHDISAEDLEYTELKLM